MSPVRRDDFSLFWSSPESIVARTFLKTCLYGSPRAGQLTAGPCGVCQASRWNRLIGARLQGLGENWDLWPQRPFGSDSVEPQDKLKPP